MAASADAPTPIVAAGLRAFWPLASHLVLRRRYRAARVFWPVGGDSRSRGARWVGGHSRRSLVDAVRHAPSAERRRRSEPACCAPTGDDLLDAISPACPIRPSRSTARAGSPPSIRRASSIAPALRRGELVSIALRVPQVVEAIRARIGERQAGTRAIRRTRAGRPLVGGASDPGQLDRAGAGGRAQLLLLTFHDLTPIRQVEEMRADFVANASHELRTPLAALSGFIETLKGPARDDAAARARFLDIMQAQATRMARLIDDLLSLSRIEFARAYPPVTPVELAPVVRQVDRLTADAGARPRRRGRGQGAERTADRARRPRRIDPRVREPDRERAQIRRRRQARGHYVVARPATAATRRSPPCAITAPAFRPSICRG